MTQVADGQKTQVIPNGPHEKVEFKQLGECTHVHPQVCPACDFWDIYAGYEGCPWPTIPK